MKLSPITLFLFFYLSASAGTPVLERHDSEFKFKDGRKTAGYIMWKDCYISDFYVEKEYRNQKLGGRLMQAALGVLSDCKVVELLAEPTDPGEVSIQALLRFYKGFGFTPSFSDRIKIGLGKIPTDADSEPSVRLFKTMPKTSSVSSRITKPQQPEKGASSGDTKNESESFSSESAQ